MLGGHAPGRAELPVLPGSTETAKIQKAPIGGGEGALLGPWDWQLLPQKEPSFQQWGGDMALLSLGLAPVARSPAGSFPRFHPAVQFCGTHLPCGAGVMVTLLCALDGVCPPGSRPAA